MPRGTSEECQMGTSEEADARWAQRRVSEGHNVRIEDNTCLLLWYQTWDLSHTLSTQKEAVRPHPHRCTTEGCFEEGLEDRAWTDGKRQDKPEEKGY